MSDWYKLLYDDTAAGLPLTYDPDRTGLPLYHYAVVRPTQGGSALRYAKGTGSDSASSKSAAYNAAYAIADTAALAASVTTTNVPNGTFQGPVDLLAWSVTGESPTYYGNVKMVFVCVSIRMRIRGGKL